MTTYYVDPANGNDANDGLGWGTAWRTLLKGASFARLGQTDSDEIRIAKSPDPVSIGDVTWTHNSQTLTIPGLTNILIDNGKTGWTRVAGTLSYTSTYTRTTGQALQIAMSAVNGKSAYKNLGTTLDLSSTSRLTFWLSTGTSVNYTAGCPVQIDLCSDTAGDVPVVRCTLPRYFYPAHYWVPITIEADAGYDFVNATSIQSITIRTSAAVTNTIRFDNFQAARGANDTTSLVLTDLIAKDNGNGEYYPIMSIQGTTVSIEMFSVNSSTTLPASPSSTYRTLDGSNETANTLKRVCFITATDVPPTGSASAIGAINYTNDANWPATKTYIGGVNPATDIVDGETWFDGVTGWGYGLTQTNSVTSSWSISSLAAVRYQIGLICNMGSNVVVNNLSLVGNRQAYSFSGGVAAGITSRNVHVGFDIHMKWMCAGAPSNSVWSSTRATTARGVTRLRIDNADSRVGFSPGIIALPSQGYTVFESSGTLKLHNPQSVQHTGAGLFKINNLLFTGLNTPIFDMATYTGTQDPLALSPAQQTILLSGKIHCSDPLSSQIVLFQSGAYNIRLKGTTPEAAITGSTSTPTLVTMSPQSQDNGTIVIQSIALPANRASATEYGIVMQDVVQPGEFTVNGGGFGGGGALQRFAYSTAVTYDGGRSLNYSSVGVPSGRYRRVQIARPAFKAGTPITITIYMNRSTTNQSCFLDVVTSDPDNQRFVVETEGDSNAWLPYTVTFTPTEDGVAAIHAGVQSNVSISHTFNGYFDGLTISQV